MPRTLSLYVPGAGFYSDGSGHHALRLCYSYPTPERIHEGVVRLGELLHEELELVRAIYETAPIDLRRIQREGNQ